MDIRIKYSKEEVNKIILEYHEKQFGNAPKGEHWHVSGDYYDGWKVENIKDKDMSAPIPDKEGAL